MKLTHVSIELLGRRHQPFDCLNNKSTLPTGRVKKSHASEVLVRNITRKIKNQGDYMRLRQYETMCLAGRPIPILIQDLGKGRRP